MEMSIPHDTQFMMDISLSSTTVKELRRLKVTGTVLKEDLEQSLFPEMQYRVKVINVIDEAINLLKELRKDI